MRILFNGIPSSGKTTLAYKLHLYLEHQGVETVYLDDEVIKRLHQDEIDQIIDICNAPVTILVSCNPLISADIRFWCLLDAEEAWKRDCAKLEREKAPVKPKLSSYLTFWSQYKSDGILIDTSKPVEECLKEVLCALKKKNLNF